MILRDDFYIITQYRNTQNTKYNYWFQGGISMWKELKEFIGYMDNVTSKELDEKEKEKLKEELQTKIGYFQHERIVHLIVMMLVALCTIIALMGFVAFKSIGIALLFVALMCLLVPYIVHYFHLENGVQKLYTYYDKIK